MQLKHLILIVMGVHLAGCSRFGVDSLDNPTASFYSNQGISASLASNLRVDLKASGIDEANAEIILNKAIALSSSLEAASSLSFNKVSGEISNGSQYQRIAEKFIEGAMLGISETDLPDNQKVLAASVNSYTPIRTLAQAGAGLSAEEKQAAVEAISAQAVAKIQTTGVSEASLASALTKISEKSVEAVSKSGVSGDVAKAMVKKAAGGATRGLSEMSISSEQAATLVQAVAAGSVKGISAFTETDDSSAADLLTEVSSGLSSGLSEIQDQVTGFDMYEALSTVESSIKEEAESTLNMDTSLVEEAFLTSQQEIKLPAPLPVLMEGKEKLANDIFLEFNTKKTTNFTALDNNGNAATVCYSLNGDTPACLITDDKAVCENNSSLYNEAIELIDKVELKAISCMTGKTPSRVNTYLVQVMALPPAYIETDSAYTSSNNSLPLLKNKAFLNSTICYTENQSAPECTLTNDAVACKNGQPYLSPINITKNQVIKAVSCASGFAPSQTVAISTQYQLDAPDLSYSNDKLSLRSSEQDTTICINTGSAPECLVEEDNVRCGNGSKEFIESITPVANTEIQALSCRTGSLNSAVSKFSYKQANEGVSFSPASGSLVAEGAKEILVNGNGSATVCLSAEAQPKCQVGFDGTASCTTGTTGNSSTLSVSENFKMFATVCDKGSLKVISASYDVPSPEPKLMLSGSELNESQVFSFDQQLDLSLLAVNDNNQNATICYTQDGSQPVCTVNEVNSPVCTQGNLYSGPLAINAPGKLYAQGCMPNRVSSAMTSFTLNFSLPQPAFSLPDGTVMEPTSNQVALEKHSSVQNAKLCYTTDQSQPACGLVNGTFGCANGTEYNAPIIIAQATQVKAVTCQEGYIGSSVVSAQYSLKSTYNSPCATLKNQGQTQSGVYNINGIGNVYCDMTTEGGGWTLFAVTTASRCAETLPYGPNAIDTDSTGYFSTLLKDVEHEQFLQIMKKDGTNTSFTIRYDFNSGKKTLKNRVNNSVSSGEDLDWIVAYGNSLQNKVEYKNKRWRYSNNAGTSSKWGGSSGNRFSNDDGIWGAANANLDGNYPGPYLRNSQGAFGHENPNSGDSMCRNVFENGSSSSHSNLKNLLFLR